MGLRQGIDLWAMKTSCFQKGLRLMNKDKFQDTRDKELCKCVRSYSLPSVALSIPLDPGSHCFPHLLWLPKKKNIFSILLSGYSGMPSQVLAESHLNIHIAHTPLSCETFSVAHGCLLLRSVPGLILSLNVNFLFLFISLRLHCLLRQCSLI